MSSFINRIPGMKNLDMEDPKDRKKAGMVILAVILLILVLVLSALDKKKDAKPALVEEQPSAMLEVPAGEDKDILMENNMISARERMANRQTPGNRDIFIEAGKVNEKDPLSFLNEDTPVANEGQNRPDPTTVTQEDALRALGLLDDKPKASQGGVSTTRQTTAGNTNTKRKKSSTPTRKPESKVEPEPEPPVLNEKADVSSTVAVRRSGSVSSLDDWGTIEGLSSLDNQDEYITEDEDHPYKVMFTQDQKVTSGSRITLRLLEDMAVGGVLIPKNTHLTATCTIGERLEISVNSIEINGRIISLGYSAFDIDGAQGLYCPTSESEKKAKAVGQQATSIATSALNTALQGAGTLIGQAARMGATVATSGSGTVTASVNSGYVFYLLKDKRY